MFYSSGTHTYKHRGSIDSYVFVLFVQRHYMEGSSHHIDASHPSGGGGTYKDPQRGGGTHRQIGRQTDRHTDTQTVVVVVLVVVLVVL